MKLPKQAAPVMRPDLIKPQTVVDLARASRGQLFNLELDLLGGANYNEPMRFLTPVDSCGCHILSGGSMAMCLAACGLL